MESKPETVERLSSRIIRRAVTSLILLTLAIVAGPGLLNLSPAVHAQLASQPPPPLVGRVCIVPGNSAFCSQTIPGSVAASGNVSINILGSTIFDKFDIRVRPFGNASVFTVDPASTILISASVTILCRNGAGVSCDSLDGPGIVHVVATGANTTAPASGQLFKILYSGNSTSTKVGFQTGCAIHSVPNTSVCVRVSTGLATDPESIQSQLFGTQLPTANVLPAPGGNITVNISGGSPTLPSVTFITPYMVALPGTITTWKVQFEGGLNAANGTVVPAGVQLKVFRPNSTSPNMLKVVSAGTLHDPRTILQTRIRGYSVGSFSTNQSVIEFFADTGIPVLPGDFIGITITAPPPIPGKSFPFSGFFGYPGVTTTPDPARTISFDEPVNATVDLNSLDTGFLYCGFGSFCNPSSHCPCWTPALQVFIQTPPPPTSTAGDGIPDFVKLGPEMHALGADPCRKTVAVQLDYMTRPLQAAIDTVEASFDAAPLPAVLPCPYFGFPQKPSGVKLIVDVDNQIPFQSWLNFTQSYPMTFDYVKAAFFDPNRALYFHYGIFAHDLAPAPPMNSISGAGEIFGQNFMVTLGEWKNGGTVKQQAGTLMHEIGHNLGLDHGGSDAANFKPNYLSVMNYAFQVTGIVTLTADGGNVTRFDYSRQQLPSLNESSLDETVPLAIGNNVTSWTCPDGHHVDFGVTSGPIDWNCNGTADTPKVSVDINNDTRLEALGGFTDWSNLQYNFTTSVAFGVGCGSRCNIGCGSRCNIGEEMTFQQAVVIEARLAAFLSSPHRSTSTTVSCSPSSVVVGSTTHCTATVSDANTGTPITPQGTVGFTSTGQGTFTPSGNCSIAGTGGSASCSVDYVPGTGGLGGQTISVAFVGDGNHTGSSGPTTIITGILPVMNLTTSETLTADFTGRIVVGASNIVINCNGHTISGVTTSAATTFPNIGISLVGKSGVTVENCKATNFYIGFQLTNSTNNKITGNNAAGNGFGFQLIQSNNTVVSRNTATANLFDGFLLRSSNNDQLSQNVASNNLGSGFRLVSSSNNNLKTNTANNNKAYGFAVTTMSNNNTVANNTANGNSLFDALQTGSAQNTFSKNAFGTTSGI